MRLSLRKFPPDFRPKSGEVRISTQSSKGFKRGDILRVSSPDGNDKSIIRQLIKTNNQETEQYIDLDYDSRLRLGIDKYFGRKVGITIRKASRFAFYWHHPNHGIRLTFYGLTVTVAGTLIGLVVTLYPSILPVTKAKGLPVSGLIDTTAADTAHRLEHATTR